MNKKNLNITVVGCGSWGSAIANLLATNGHTVYLWGRNKELIDSIINEKENKKYLSGIKLDKNLFPISDIISAIKISQIVVFAIPSHSFRELFKIICTSIQDNTRILSAIKGIENCSFSTMTNIVEELLYSNCPEKEGIETGVLSGPSFAREVSRRLPTAVTIGFKNIKTAQELQNVFVNDYFRVYTSTDVIGLEISSALKNIIAIASGICEGLGFGQNARAALITRGLIEIKRLGVRLNCKETTFNGLSGVGDLVLTCTGDLSRNRYVGLKLGEGFTLKEILSEMKMVAEGVKTTLSVYNLSEQLKIEMPITEQVYKILYEGKICSIAVNDLLMRELKNE